MSTDEMNTSDLPAPSAKKRLQASREALIHQLQPSTRSASAKRVSAKREDRQDAVQVSGRISDEGIAEKETVQQVQGVERPNEGMLSAARESLQAWWQFHPAHTAVAIAQPVLAEYAHRRPFKLLGIAAGIGATVVVVRPWKLVSLGGLAMTALKSSQVSTLALSMLASRKRK